MAEKYPKEAVAVSSKGKREARIFVEKGTYIRYTYKDADSGKLVQEGKESVVLKNDSGKKEQLFIIPMKSDKSLLIKSKNPSAKICWDEKKKKSVSL
jgi:hypothetical protein